MDSDPLSVNILFQIGFIPISRAVVTTWGIMLFLTIVSWLILRRAHERETMPETVLEIIVEALDEQVGSIIQSESRSYMPLLGTLFIFLFCANLAAIVPGMNAPTAHIETPAALAAVVFLSVHFFGLRAHGLLEYVRRYSKPNILLLPLNILSEFTRTFSLMVRLFGNIMSHELIIGIVVLLAGLFLPIPFMLLGILIGIIQAYIFTVLAAVFIGAAVGSIDQI